MKSSTLRGYVWLFCGYLFVSTQWLVTGLYQFRPQHSANTHLSFLDIITLIFTPGFLAYMCFSLCFRFDDFLEKCIAALTGTSFAISLIINAHKLGYVPFNVPHWLGSFLFFLATFIFGFRLDRILKERDAETETASMLETAEDE